MELSPTIKNYINADGKMTQRPSKRSRQADVLAYLASHIAEDFEGTEKEVNMIIEDLHTFWDIALLRRELYVAGYLDRSADGARYWKK